MTIRIFLLIVCLGAWAPAPAQSAAKDVMLVLDNSGSMKRNDPEFLTNKAVKAFIAGLEGDVRTGIVIFDQDVNLAVPLTPVGPDTSDKLLGALRQIDYSGQYTDSPAAIERAIYELKNNGREDVRKAIIFMTDGIVDTGNPELDAEKTSWLRDDLTAEAAAAGISIFAIAFTQSADFLLIQSLARRTDGEYFRAVAPEDLEPVFQRVNEALAEPPAAEAEPAAPPPEAEPLPAPAPSARPPAPSEGGVTITPPPQREAADERLGLMLLAAIVGVIVLLLVVTLVLVLRRRGGGAARAQAQYVPQAFLNDVHGYTDDPSYEIGAKPVMLGRVAGNDKNLEYIVVNQTTVGRRHALIEYKDYGFWITDQGSVNGTFVNDERVDRAHRLTHGDRIRLHKFDFEFSVPELADSGQTVFSGPAAEDAGMERTVMAGAGTAAAAGERGPGPEQEAEQAQGHEPAAPAHEVAPDDSQVDLDLFESEGDTPPPAAQETGETEVRPGPEAPPPAPGEAAAQGTVEASEAETLVRGEDEEGGEAEPGDVSMEAFINSDVFKAGELSTGQGTAADTSQAAPADSDQDEAPTLMSGARDDSEASEDVTLTPDMSAEPAAEPDEDVEDVSLENFMDAAQLAEDETSSTPPADRPRGQDGGDDDSTLMPSQVDDDDDTPRRG